MLRLALLLAVFTPANAAEDSFLWLEEVDSARSLEWVGKQNESTLSRLQTRAIYPTLEREMSAIITSTSRLPSIVLNKGRVSTFWQDPAHPRGLWQRASLESYKAGTPAWDILLDLDALNAKEEKTWVWKGADCLQPENRLCLISLSLGGGDAVEVREFDRVSKTFVEGGFVVPLAKSDVGWIDADHLFVGTDFGPGTVSKSGYPLVVKRWKRGTLLAQATEAIHGQPDDVTASAYVNHQPGWMPELLVRSPSFFESEVFLTGEGAPVRIPLPRDAVLETVMGSKAFFLLHSDLKTKSQEFANGSLVAYPLLRAGEGDASLEGLELVFAPTEKRFLSGVVRSGNSLLLNILDNVRGKVLRAQRAGPGWRLKEIPMGENGVASVVHGSAFDDSFLATYMDFLTPVSQFTGHSLAGKVELLRSSPSFFDASGLTTEQLEAKSKDGTKIPYFLVRAKNLKLDGTNPTLLYGYGGFNLSMKPWYSGTNGKAWLEKGGVYALANIRGGGEFGPAWHEAARKKNRQRAFDDFIAVAEDLLARKITSPAHLGIQGGSNGGLLVGAAYTQRPELFNAVLCEVPLLDMLRYHLLLAGASWIDEYGDPDDLEMREVIAKYSPYQNLRADGQYPEVFFTTSTRDDRVHPGHARKMAALMEAQGHGFYFFENTEGGHGGSATPEQRARLLALEYSYLWAKLGENK